MKIWENLGGGGHRQILPTTSELNEFLKSTKNGNIQYYEEMYKEIFVDTLACQKNLMQVMQKMPLNLENTF